MKIAKFGITGNGGLLMHNPSSMRGTTGEMQRGGKKIPLPLDEARAGLYAMPKGQLYIKPDWFREAALTAATDLKDPQGKRGASFLKRFGAAVFLCTEHCPLYRASDRAKPITTAGEDWTIDVRRAVVQRQGILRARPRIEDWYCELEFEYDEEAISPAHMLQVLTLAGKTPGIGDYRIGRKGPFGRFTVELLNGVKS